VTPTVDVVTLGAAAAEMLLDVQGMSAERVSAERIHLPAVSQGLLTQRQTHWFDTSLKL